MIRNPNSRITKGMIFAGCSFTWGQGLYYYSNLPTLSEPLPDHYDETLLTGSHLEYAKRKRYPRLVANHFNTFEHVHPKNGGSNQSAVGWWEACFSKNKNDQEVWREGFIVPRIDYTEISHVFFQLTQFQRNNFTLEYNGETHSIPLHEAQHGKYTDIFVKWLDQRGQTFDNWLQTYIQDNINQVKNFLENCESHGITTYIMTWPPMYLDYIDRDPWLQSRLITFDYNGKSYRSIEDLMSPSFMHCPQYNPEMTIKFDRESFGVTPKDHHPSSKCHQVIANAIIKRIEKN